MIHFIEHGLLERRTALPQPINVLSVAARIDIVVPVYNALEDVEECLSSVLANRDGFRTRLIVVNDGSDAATTAWLRNFAKTLHPITLIEHDVNLGYTKAVNAGLRASDASYVITLNSDTIVTRGWLKGMVRCMNSAPDIGIVGPLSNAASWQNVPDLYGEDGQFAINRLHDAVSPEQMATLVAGVSSRRYPRTNFVNGFCFMIRREVIDAVGYMDEQAFPVGYGEENDFCIRAADCGFKLAIADDSYVFHAKSKSFGHSQRQVHSRHGSDALKKKHGADKVARLVRAMKQTGEMDAVRKRIRYALDRLHLRADAPDFTAMKVLFLLPVKGGGGGAHSVVQEVVEMRRLGWCAKMAVRPQHIEGFIAQYKEVHDITSAFVGVDDDDLLRVACEYDVVVGTIFASMGMVRTISEALPHVLPAYYVQDYEPLFFPEGSEQWRKARDSYELVPNAVAFAKTHWIIEKVKAEHGTTTHKVEPSIDHAVYRPRPRVRDGRIHISAMIRPQTPRRGAERTMRLFSSLAECFPGLLSFHLFGCDADDHEFSTLVQDFDFENHGKLLRPGVAEVLSRSDIFVDLSDYQAFGRTALEAMACGCAPVVPVHGGADEYAIDGFNAIVVDSFDEEATFRRLADLIRDAQQVLPRMCANGLATAARYSVHRAAVSEWMLLSASLSSHRQLHPAPKTRLLLSPSTTKGGGTITGSGYVRVVLPYFSDGVLANYAVRFQEPGVLPTPGKAEIFVLQRDAPGIPLSALRSWLNDWRLAGGRLVYDLDDDLLDAGGLQARGYTGDVQGLADKVTWLVERADLVTVSTPALARRLRQWNPSIAVFENRLDGRLWRLGYPRNHSVAPFGRREEVVRIGYIGTPSHDQDLTIVSEAIRRIEAEFSGRVEIEVIGGFERAKPMFGKRVGLPKRHDYPRFVDWLHRRVHWDIGIIPLADDEFNRSKSYVKFLEYAALDMAIICSNVEAYQPVARHEENALVVGNDSESWYAALRRLVLDSSLRSRLARSAREELRTNHTLDHADRKYIDAITTLLEPKGHASAGLSVRVAV